MDIGGISSPDLGELSGIDGFSYAGIGGFLWEVRGLMGLLRNCWLLFRLLT